MKLHKSFACLTTVFLAFLMHAACAQHQVKAGRLIAEPPTLICLGFEWYLEGDANRNATANVEYRKKGESDWKSGPPLLRIGGEKAGEPVWNYTTENMLAGSLIDLQPDTEYQCRLTIGDPDGVEGQTEHLLSLKTRKEPTPYAGGEVRHVYPEDWEAEKEEPAYNGILDAYYGYPRFADWILTADPVEAGDRIIVHAGTYKADFTNYRDYHGLTFDGTYFFTQKGSEGSPISIVAAGDGEVVIDGNGAAVLFDMTVADHHYLEGLTLRNTDVAIRAGLMNAYGADGLSVKHCRFEDIGIGIQAQYEGSQGYYIADNIFLGREDSTMVYHNKIENGRNVQRIASYYAVKLHGQGHTVAYNDVKYFFDGIDICTHARPETNPALKSVAMDFYNNDIFICNDNFIEADGGTHNIRILRNRCFNSGQQALSNQPVLAGPVYWIRNVVYNVGDASTFKFWGMYPAGVLAYHNTSSGIFTRDDKPGSNVHLRNNLFLPSDDASLASLGLYTYTSYSSLDYNGYRERQPFISYHAPNGGQTYDFSNDHKALEFNSLQKFTEATGQEQHGITVDYDIFRNAKAPEFKEFREKHQALGKAYPIYRPQDFDFRLKEGSKAVDAGVHLPGINDGFTGEAPDLGAYEVGKPVPIYGPRKKSDVQ